ALADPVQNLPARTDDPQVAVARLFGVTTDRLQISSATARHPAPRSPIPVDDRAGRADEVDIGRRQADPAEQALGGPARLRTIDRAVARMFDRTPRTGPPDVREEASAVRRSSDGMKIFRRVAAQHAPADPVVGASRSPPRCGI